MNPWRKLQRLGGIDDYFVRGQLLGQGGFGTVCKAPGIPQGDSPWALELLVDMGPIAGD